MYISKYFLDRRPLGLIAILFLVTSLCLIETSLGADNDSAKHFKMLSSVEYTGKTQFKSQVETLLTERKEFLSDDKTQYFISTSDFDLIDGEISPGRATQELSFVLDRNTKYMSAGGEDLALYAKVNNQCVRSLEKVTKDNLGQTWEQTFGLSFFGNPLASEIKFKLTAIQLQTTVFGEMIAVRALSEPFTINITTEDGQIGTGKAEIGAVYLFDPEIEDIYMSVSVFEVKTKANGFKEKLRREVATYRTTAEGTSIDLSGLGKKFEKLVRKIGLTKKSVKVKKEAPLPQWAQSEGLTAAQIADICAGIACEGAPNPVAAVCVPAARTAALQGAGKLAAIGQAGSVSSLLSAGVPALGSMKIAVAPAFMGVGMGTTGAVAGGTVAIAGGGSSGSSSSRTPTN